MRELIKRYITAVLSSYKWYRRQQGCKWYKIRDDSFAGGFEGTLTCWVQSTEDWKGATILKEEDWSKKGSAAK